MLVVFSPALGDTVHVSVNATRKSTTQLHFTATLSSPEYEQVAYGGVRLQVWSDIPASDRHSSDWGEADFRPLSFSANRHEFSLLPLDEQDKISTSLFLDFSIPFSDGQRFSFTYRMLYPTGEIKWLGDYGENGNLVLHAAESEPVLLGNGWVRDGNDLYCRDPDSNPVQHLEVAKLSHPVEYTAYAADSNRSFLHPKDAHLIILVPRLSSRPIVLPPTLIFGASPSASISFAPRGAITMSGTGSLFFAACESAQESETAISKIINPCSSSRFRVVNYKPGAIILASAVDRCPVELCIVPIASPNTTTQSSLTLGTMALLAPSGFCIFSDLQCDAQIFAREAVEGSEHENVTFTAGQSGGQFILAPIKKLDHGDEVWQVGMVSPYTSVSPTLPVDGLPTPPPSPRLRPLTHRISETMIQSPDPSFLSLPAAISSDDRSAPGSSSSLIVHASSHRTPSVIAAIRHIFLVLFAWFIRIFRRRRPEPKRIADERTPLLQDESTSAQSRVEVSTNVAQDNVSSATSSISFEVGDGKVTMVFEAGNPSSTFNVPIQLNGEHADLNVQETSGGVFVVEFSSNVGGRLKIGW